MYIVHVFRIGIVSIPWKVTCSNSRTTGVLYSRYVSYNIRGIRRKAGQLTMRSMIGKRAIYICNLISNEIFKLLRFPSIHLFKSRVKFEQFLAYKSSMEHTRDWKWSIYRKTNDRFFRNEYSILCFLHSFFPPLPSLKRDNLGPDLDPSFFIYQSTSKILFLSLSFSLFKNPRSRLN